MARDRTRARTYQLEVEVGRPLRIAIGRLGEFDFPAGCYVYTGSARRGLDARVQRHLSGARRLHWHIDYLLAMPGVRITDVSTTDEPECTANQRTGGAIVVQGFGSSDCASGCGSHLKLIARQRPPREFAHVGFVTGASQRHRAPPGGVYGKLK